MSENKKYFYLKLKDSFFSSEEMMMLENLSDGLVYQNIYLRLCLLSLKTEGALMFKNMIPYDAKMLSTVLHIDFAKMEVAIKTFTQLGLIVKTDSKTLFMADIQSLIGQSSTEAERIARYRKRIASNNVTEMLPDKECTKSVQMLQNCTPELEKEIEKDIDIEIDRQTCAIAQPTPEEVFNFYLDNHLPISPERFWRYNNKRKWKDKDGKPIKNWQQAYIDMSEGSLSLAEVHEPYSPFIKSNYDFYTGGEE